MADEERTLIARFLRSNNYTETLNTFLGEAGLPPDTGSTAKDDLTLEKLLVEKRAYDLSVNFEKLGTNDVNHWAKPAPSTPKVVEQVANVLYCTVSRSVLRWSTADRRLCAADCNRLETVDVHHHGAPILSMAECSRFIIYGDMGGNIVLATEGETLDRRKDHTKYVVRVAISEEPLGVWIATAGWDKKVALYWIPHTRQPPQLLHPVTVVELPTNPEALLFVRCPDSGQTRLLLSRQDSTYLYYYSPDNDHGRLELLGKQNLAPHTLSWITFTPSQVVLCPTDPSRVAVATSSVPHMKLLIVRLLFPGNAALAEASEAVSERSRAQVEQDREEAAIMISCNTMAPQTQYSTPVVAWRPNGSGVFIGGDDGKIRGIEASTGKVVCQLEAHDPGTKIRCLWAVSVHEEEWLLSGGFDQRLIVWR